MKIFISILLGGVTLFGAQIIQMSKKQQDNLGVKIQKVVNIDSISFGPYNGVVVLDKKDIISMGSNVESVVKEIHIRKFQKVKKGDKLLTLRSNELLNLQKEYIQALINSANIDETYERNVKLQEEGIISFKKLAISQKEKFSSDLNVKLSKSYLLSSGLTNSILSKIAKTYMPIMQINLLAPRDGVIYDVDVNIGQIVSSDKSMIGIYGTGARYIEVTIPLKMIKNISLGDICRFSSYSAKISSIGSVVNSASQSVQVRAVIKNSKNIMINRIYSVNISKHINGSVKIKKSALVYQDNNSYVFKKVSNGFEVTSVEIISEGPTCYIVKANLKAGDKLAVSSTSALLGGMEEENE